MMIPLNYGPEPKPSLTALQVTMAELTAFLSVGGKQIIDQTGLTGKCDFDLPKFDTTPPEGAAPNAHPPMPDAAHVFDWSAIGLEIKPIKVPTAEIVIDHIERPSPN